MKTKKSQGNVIAVILIILLCLVAIIILWRLFFPITENTQQEIGLRQELSKTQIGVNDVSGDLQSPEGGILEITLTRGSEKLKLENTSTTVKHLLTTTTKISSADVISALDISSSMNDLIRTPNATQDIYCKAIVTNSTNSIQWVNDCCYHNNNCSTPADCSKCYGGVFDSSKHVCRMMNTPSYCCNTHNLCSDPTNCTYCASFTNNTFPQMYPWYFSSDGWFPYTYTDPTYSDCYDNDVQVGTNCPTNSLTCSKCNGTVWTKIIDTGTLTKCLVNACCNQPGVNCSIASNCTACNGTLDTDNMCLMSWWTYYIPSCCQQPGVDCSTFKGCNQTCGFRYVSGGGTVHTEANCVSKGILTTGSHIIGGVWSRWTNYPYDPNSCFTNEEYCKRCEGEYVSECIGADCGVSIPTKLNFTITAFIGSSSSQGLIDNYTANPNNSMGFVSYAGNIINYISSSNDPVTLKSYILSLGISGTSTNACQALNKSIGLLKYSTKPVKAIILMTDGNFNSYCNGVSMSTLSEQSNVNNEVIAMASVAQSFGIKVYTIGIGKDSDNATLKLVAEAGNGTFYYSDIEQLKDTYSTILSQLPIDITETQTVYTNEQAWNTLRFVISNDTSSYTYDMPQDVEILLPDETKSYEIKTGGITNINKIEVYIVAHTDNGKEVSELVTTWNPQNY